MVLYTFLIFSCSVLQTVATLRQMHDSNTPAAQARVSLLTMGMQAIVDAYVPPRMPCPSHETVACGQRRLPAR